MFAIERSAVVRTAAGTLDGLDEESRTARVRFETAIDLFVRECYARRAVVRVGDFAARVGLSRQRLNKMVVKAFGKVLREVLRERQLAYAAQLLLTTRLDLAETARASGFGHRATLHRLFTLHYGVSPSQYRRTETRRAEQARQR